MSSIDASASPEGKHQHKPTKNHTSNQSEEAWGNRRLRDRIGVAGEDAGVGEQADEGVHVNAGWRPWSAISAASAWYMRIITVLALGSVRSSTVIASTPASSSLLNVSTMQENSEFLGRDSLINESPPRD